MTYPNGLASDGSVEHFLIFEQGFKTDGARDLLAEFKETANYAGIFQPSNIVDKKGDSAIHDDGEEETPHVKVGDKVQATVNGVDIYPDGATVLGFSDNGQWVFTDKSSGGVSIKEIEIMEAVATPSVKPPQIPAHLLAALKANTDEAVPEGTRKAVFPLEDGDVALIFPKGISTEGLSELGQYLDIFLKKERKKPA